MESYAYIDESGDLGEKGSRYFIITAVWIDNPQLFDRIIKNIRRHKFRRELRKAQEIKANKSSKLLIEHILKKISKIETAHAQSIVFDKNNIRLNNDKNKLYNHISSYLSNIAIDAKKLIIRIDRSKGKQCLIDDFNHDMNKIFKETRWYRELEIHHSWSQSWSGLQMADVVSWAAFQKFEHNDDYFLRIIENKVNIIHI